MLAPKLPHLPVKRPQDFRPIRMGRDEQMMPRTRNRQPAEQRLESEQPRRPSACPRRSPAHPRRPRLHHIHRKQHQARHRRGAPGIIAHGKRPASRLPHQRPFQCDNQPTIRRKHPITPRGLFPFVISNFSNGIVQCAAKLHRGEPGSHSMPAASLREGSGVCPIQLRSFTPRQWILPTHQLFFATGFLTFSGRNTAVTTMTTELPVSQPPGQYALYSPQAIGLATFLGAPIAGTVLMGLNYRQLGQPILPRLPSCAAYWPPSC